MQARRAPTRRGPDRLPVFVAALGWSRAAYVEFTRDEKLETLIRCHERAFAALGGVPREALYDNMRTVVLERNAYGIGRHRAASVPPRVPRPRAARRLRAAALPALQGAHRGQEPAPDPIRGRALHPRASRGSRLTCPSPAGWPRTA